MGRKPKKALDRKDLIQGANELVSIAANGLAELNEDALIVMDKDIMNECRVAHAQFHKNDAAHVGPDSVRNMTSHQKMKVVQDYWATAFLHPTMRRRFLAKAAEEPVQFARIMASVMPKELNVDVTQQKGVLLVPMRMESMEEWEKRAIETINGETVQPPETPTRAEEFDWEGRIYGNSGAGATPDVPDPDRDSDP